MDCILVHFRMAISIAIIGYATPTGQVGEDGQEYNIDTRDIKLSRTYIYGRDEVPEHSLQDLVKKVVGEYEATTLVMILEGIHDNIEG